MKPIIFNKKKFQPGKSPLLTWNIESHASANCPQVFGTLIFPTNEANVAKYFTIRYRYQKWG